MRAAEEAAQSAWNDGCPLQSLHNADELMQSFKSKAKNLGKDGKLRILIIGDSLSDGGYHWSHYFRKDLQDAYGQGGFGNIVAGWGKNGAASWLWDAKKDFTCEPTGIWRDSFGGQGDAWPYLGWNGRFICTDSPAAEWRLEAPGSKFTVVYSKGTFKTFSGKWAETRCAGFTATLDADARQIEPAKADEALDIGLLKFEVPDGPHTLKISAIHDGMFYFHGVLVENSAPGVVFYNIAHGGWWAHDFVLRQPGWEKILAEMNPDYTIVFLSKPESGGTGSPSQTSRNLEFELLTQRVKAALPQTKLLFFQNWSPRDGISPSDLQTCKDRIAWFESNHHPYLDLYAGLNKARMKEFGWYADNIHLAPPGGKGIGHAISRLFLP
jgi:hypothetical protein